MSQIKRVVLYKHGVGYFERQARVEGDAELKLSFRTEEMNDVLKSLTVYDSGDGVVTSISYDNKKPLSVLLDEVALEVPEDGGSVELFSALRGANVAVTIGGRTVYGQLIGIDERSLQTNGSAHLQQVLSVFDDQGRLQRFDLAEIGNVALLDKELQDDLRFVLQTIFSSKKQDAKGLKIFSRGNGERDLEISYVVECPVWKTSYRIGLPGPGEEGALHLQGWALVDNPQDEDWSDVELSLVSGLPVSFRHDLYSPRYLARKEIAVDTESSVGPVMSEPERLDKLPDPPTAAPVLYMSDSAKSVRARGVRKSAAPVETVTQKVGQLFSYKIDRPVTVLRNQSALVPIVNREFDGRKRLLYNEQNRAENPFLTVELKNSSDLTLEGGPVTIYEGELYAGEAMLDTLAPNEERMLAYAVALDVEVRTSTDSEVRSVSQSVSAGAWTHQQAQYQMTSYEFDNRSSEQKTIVVEHPRSNGELIDTPEPVGTTRNNYRFEVPIEARSRHSFKVTIKTLHRDKKLFTHVSLDTIYSLIKGTVTSSEGKKILAELEGALEEERTATQKISTLANQIAEITSEQKRIRENLQSLGDTQEERSLRSRYVGKLDGDETELASLKEQMDEAKAEQERVRKDFREKAKAISLERLFD